MGEDQNMTGQTRAGDGGPSEGIWRAPAAIDLDALFHNMESGFALHEVITDASGDVVDYRYLMVNPAFERLTGLRGVIGRTVRELLPGIEPFWIQRFGRVAMTGVPDQIEDYAGSLDRWYQVRAYSPGLRQFAVLFHDVTERKRYEEALQRFEFILSNTKEEFYLVRPGGRLAYCNLAAAQSLGYTIEEMLRLGVPDFDLGYDAARFRSHFEELKAGEIPPFETVHRAKDGRLVPKDMHSVYLCLGKEEFVCGFGHDISDRKRAEADRQRMDRQIQQTQKLESLGVLAGGIAHDFNNILTAVIGNVELVRAAMPPDAPGVSYLGEIDKASQRAAELCRQLLAYAGEGRFVTEVVSLNELISDMLPMVKVSIANKALLCTDLGEGVPPIEADVTQIRQIVMNLVMNAAEASTSGAGHVTLRTSVRHCASEDLTSILVKDPLPAGRYVCLEVSDVGTGMPAELVPRIFEPFFTTKANGRGLGLAAVLGIVGGHRGALQVATAVGKGTTFRVLLPALD